METTDKEKKFLDREGVKKVLETVRDWDAELKREVDEKSSLTPWQEDYLKRQEEAERLSKFTATLSVTPSANELTGENVELTLTATTKYNGKAVSSEVTPTSANLKDVVFTNGVGHYVYNSPASSTGKETLSLTVKCVYTDDLGKIEKSASASQTRYAPIKFLSSAASLSLTSSAILSATQKQVKSAIKGDYTIAFTAGEYVWVCIPSFLTATKFTSEGFGVPMEEPVTVNVPIGSTSVSYKCYRVSGKPQTSPMKLTIE